MGRWLGELRGQTRDGDDFGGCSGMSLVYDFHDACSAPG
jgi:hypothetical protein